MSTKRIQSETLSYKEFLGISKISDGKTSPLSSIRQIVPQFQRGYVWGTKEVEDIMQSILDNDPQFYIGNMVIIGGDGTSSRDQIVDGQQRITTFSLIIAAVLEIIKLQKINTLKEKDLKMYLFDSSTNSLRLEFSDSDSNDIYKKIINHHKFTNEEQEEMHLKQKVFLKNYTKIISFLKKNANNDVSIKNFINKLCEVEIVIVKCLNEEDAFSLFMGLNATGIELTPAELVKSSILKVVFEIDKEKVQDITKKWKIMEEKFIKEKSISLFPKFLRHQLISTNGLVQNSNLFSKIKEYNLKDKDLDKINYYVDELNKDAGYYIAMRNKDASFLFKSNKLILKSDPKEISLRIKEDLEKISFLEVDQVYEVLLSLFKVSVLEDKKQISGSVISRRFFKDLRKIFAFALIMKYTSVSPAKYEKDFASLCKKITEAPGIGGDMGKILDDFFKKTLYNIANNKESEFKTELVSKLKYKEKKGNDFLLRLILDYLHTSSPSVAVSNPTIEHIMPKEDTKAQWPYVTIKDILLKNNLGNLTILDKKENSIAKGSFNDKYKLVYSKNVFLLNKNLKANYGNDFNKEPKKAIDDRGDEIAGKIYKYYLNIIQGK